ncbi:DUF5694 domain-containing protein [Sphingomonas parva]|nr:DUF5694 domain-containing protein [Sphingomonas parva]
MRGIVIAMLAALGVASAAKAGAFDPRRHKAEIAGAPTQILVLGSPHLSGMPPGFRAELLEPLLARLAAFRPQVITIEALSGSDCDMLQRFPALYGSAYQDFCRGTAEAQKATGLSVAEALDAIDKTFATWPAAPSAAERRRLAALFLAAGDRASAMVQWLRLSPSERRPTDGLEAALVKILERKDAKLNESFEVAATLAARLGLERVHPSDDHSADAIVAKADDSFGAALGEIRGTKAAEAGRADYERRVAALTDGDAVLGFYRHMNAPATQDALIAADFGAAARHHSPALFGRQYLAWWETRNLRMAANIRAASGTRPGARVLAIVGASHKAYLEAYLEMMQDVALVDAEAVLK